MLDGYSRRDFLFGVLATGALSATSTYFVRGGRGLPKAPKIQLTLDTGSDETGAHKLLKDIWERDHPDITVELVDTSNSTNDQKATMIGDAANGKADILNLDVINIQDFAKRGLISEIELEDVDGFLPITRQPAIRRRQGKTLNESDSNPYWAAPFNADAGMIFERLRTDRPLPDSQDTLSQIIDERVRKQSHGFAAQLPTQPGSASREAFVVNVLEHALSRREDILDLDGMPHWDLTAWQAALQPLRTATSEGKIFQCDDERDTRDAFRKNTLPYMRNWPVEYSHLVQDEDPDAIANRIRIRPLPVGILGGQSLAVVKKSPNASQALEVVRFFTSVPAQIILAAHGFAPTRIAAYNDPSLPAFNPRISLIRKAIEAARPRPIHPNYSRFSDVVVSHAQKLLTDGVELSRDFIEEMSAALPNPW
jgi:multiple sugar transport system substrate-binding protein